MQDKICQFCARSLFLFLCCSHFSLLANEEETKPIYSFGIVPQQSASKIAQRWVPLLNHISQSSGYSLRFKTAKNIPAFEEQLEKAVYDIAYMNPYHYTLFSQQAGYQALLKASNNFIQGIIVVHKDSPYKNLEELMGKKLALPSANAFAASMLTQAELKQRKITMQIDYVSSHDSVYRNIAQGRHQAGGGVIRTLENLNPAIRDQLRILWKSQKYTPHAIATHSRIPKQTRLKIQQAFIELSDSSRGQHLLKKLNIQGFSAANDSDWDDVRQLNLTP